PSTSTQPTSPPAREPGANFADKSIAVLPLENLSDDKENAYFADGIQDDLLSSLARIKELKVISRSSVMGYRNAATRNLREISQQLGVSHVLEGSVRRTANRVLVNVALIATRTGQQIWAEHYDRALADSLTLQGELAREIAAALRATLSPEEKARVAAKPTENADAYVLYLRGREFQTRPTLLLGDLQAAENFYQQALALDPSFALAHARLSAALAYIYLNYQSSADLKTRARAAAEEALRLRPDGGEGSLARALCLYWVDKDYPAALRELEIAARLLPGNAEIDLYAGAIRRRQGLWREALVNMRRSLNRDPRAMLTAREIMITDFALRDWPAALRDGEYAVTCAPELPLLRVEKNWAHVWLSNDLGPLTADLAAVPAGVDPDGGITIARWDAALLARDFAAAERVVLAPSAPERVVSVFGPVLPRSYLRGCTLLARGESARAQEFFADARPAMEAEAREYPQDAFRQAQLGILYAYLGRKEDALRYARRAVELLPESKDALYGTCLAGLVALIQARAGETEQAITLLTRLLHTPGPVLAAFEGSVTQRELRLRWQWDPLRNDPRFQALVNGPEPATVY
ncbi:MAG: hypothetical protein JO117_02990, partial [Verrucomicrobia bacterium]|nr:hypothetical protein [Verrucomicrobiota bacterium]